MNELQEREPQELAERPQTLLATIQDAIANGAKPNELKEIMDLYERMELKQDQRRFAESFAAFQHECPQIRKSREFQGRHYASLDDIMKVCQPILSRHGISLAFDTEHVTEGGKAVINVTLRMRVGSYSEDRKFGCPVPVELKASQPQQWGAALSYAKRYAVCAALNIVVTDEDNDAQTVVSTILATELIEMEALIKQTDISLERMLKWLKIESLDQCPRLKYGDAMAFLRTKVVKA